MGLARKNVVQGMYRHYRRLYAISHVTGVEETARELEAI
jgi:hypothetical protein